MVNLTTLAYISILSLELCLPVSSSNPSVPEASGNTGTIPQIKANLEDLSTDITALTTSINAFPALRGNLTSALVISTQMLSVANTLGKGAACLTSNGAIALSDGTSIFNTVKPLANLMQHTLTAIVNKKSAFTGLGPSPSDNRTSGIIVEVFHRDLTFLKGNASSFGDAMILLNAAQLTPLITTVHDGVLGVFDKAITAYSIA